MLAVTWPGALFVIAVTAVALGMMGRLLSGAPGLVTRSLRASATTESADDASGSDRPVPMPDATPEHRDR